jgi:Bacteriophage replication gene A protein (GPA).
MDQDKDDETGESVKETAKHVCAWKSRWSIRQFQFFGGAPVTTYRELRRYANIDKASFNEYLTTLSRKELIAIYDDHAMAADLHGPRLPASQLKTKDLFMRISNAYQPTVEHPSGNVVQAMQSADTGDWMGYVMGQGGPFVKRKDLIIRNTYDVTPFGSPYGEAVSKIGGINAAGMEIKTRLRRFQIVPKSKVAQVADALSGGAAASRSSVNNCTPTSGDILGDQFARIAGQGYELGSAQRRSMTNGENLGLSGASITVGDGRSVRIRHIIEKGLDENGQEVLIEHAPQLVDVETSPPETDAMQLDNILLAFPHDLTIDWDADHEDDWPEI